MVINIDETDKQILSCLEKNGRIPISIIAEELGVSNTMIIKRINKLIKNKIILSFSPIYDEKKLGMAIVLSQEYFSKKNQKLKELLMN